MLSHLDIHAEVADGHVTLIGKVEWKYESDEAERMVGRVLGVTTVTNLIGLQPRASLSQVEAQIANALARHAANAARSAPGVGSSMTTSSRFTRKRDHGVETG